MNKVINPDKRHFVEWYDYTHTHILLCTCGFAWTVYRGSAALEEAKVHVNNHQQLGEYASIRKITPRKVQGVIGA